MVFEEVNLSEDQYRFGTFEHGSLKLFQMDA